jgi:hypothetical protein
MALEVRPKPNEVPLPVRLGMAVAIPPPTVLVVSAISAVFVLL